MIHIQGKISQEITVAVSGGPDSMAVLDFLKRRRTGISAAYFNHDTSIGDHCQDLIKEYCKDDKIPFTAGHIGDYEPVNIKESPQEFWRDRRYRFLDEIDGPMITAHHLDDCVEEWLISCIRRGRPNIIPYRYRNIIRPFRLTSKDAFIKWCHDKDVPCINDPSNQDTRYLRSAVRWDLIPLIEQNINPGITKTVRKIVLNSFSTDIEL